jgi:hypothetical protein
MPNPVQKKRWAIAGVLLAAAGGGALAIAQVPTPPVNNAANKAAPQAMPAADAMPGSASSPVPAAQAGVGGGAAPVVMAPKPPQDPHRARITFSTIPMTNAKVVWGKTTLGNITPKQALTIVRPRDTGPLDVMVYAPGFLPVQTRAHTFEDQQIVVKLTTPENKQTLWGYRAPIDAGVMPSDQLPTSPEMVPSTPQL